MKNVHVWRPSHDGETNWQCLVCGYIHKGTHPPKRCPVCGASEDRFVVLDD